ncbi:MAG: hypothetical protein WCG05_01765 [Alphaproteobacteria bacterium]
MKKIVFILLGFVLALSQNALSTEADVGGTEEESGAGAPNLGAEDSDVLGTPTGAAPSGQTQMNQGQGSMRSQGSYQQGGNPQQMSNNQNQQSFQGQSPYGQQMGYQQPMMGAGFGAYGYRPMGWNRPYSPGVYRPSFGGGFVANHPYWAANHPIAAVASALTGFRPGLAGPGWGARPAWRPGGFGLARPGWGARAAWVQPGVGGYGRRWR